MKPEELLYTQVYEKQSNLERLRKQHDQMIIKECNNFQPKINKKSARMDQKNVQKLKRDMEDQNCTENVCDDSSDEQN